MNPSPASNNQVWFPNDLVLAEWVRHDITINQEEPKGNKLVYELVLIGLIGLIFIILIVSVVYCFQRRELAN